MAAWFEQDTRLDIAIALSLEVAVLRLSRAANPGERREAEAFNRRLWRTAAALAPSAPVAEDRAALAAAAAKVAAGDMPSEDLAALNIALAGRLAGRAATGGALRRILTEWRAVRTAARAEFGTWLVERLEGFLEPELARAA